MKETLRKELERKVADRSPQDRRILFVGILNKHLPSRNRAVLVGGALVEFYTAGAYVTGDVDLLGDREAIRTLLKDAGFAEQGRYLFREDLGLVVEVPGRTGRPTENVVEVEFEDYRIPCVSVEDAIVDRLLAAKFWRSPTDWEQAILLFVAQRRRVDVARLRAKAKPNDVEDKVDDLLRTVDLPRGKGVPRKP